MTGGQADEKQQKQSLSQLCEIQRFDQHPDKRGYSQVEGFVVSGETRRQYILDPATL